MYADKAYLSVENVEAIHDAGGTPFIAPKSNTTGAAGGLFEKMFHYYQYHREEAWPTTTRGAWWSLRSVRSSGNSVTACGARCPWR
jgi:hypothetical protein